MKRAFAWLVRFSCVATFASGACAESLSGAAKSAVADVENRADELKAVNQSIWKFAEVESLGYLNRAVV